MTLIRSIKGFSFTWLIIIAVVVGFGGIYGFKIGKPYMDAATLRGIVQRTLQTAKQDTDINVVEVRKRIFDNANVQQLGLEFDAIDAARRGPGQFEVNIEMTRKIPLWKDANLVLDLKIEEVTP